MLLRLKWTCEFLSSLDASWPRAMDRLMVVEFDAGLGDVFNREFFSTRRSGFKERSS